MSITRDKSTEAEPAGPKAVVTDAGVLTDVGRLAGVVSGMPFSSHLPSLRMCVLVWYILKQRWESFVIMRKKKGLI